MIGPWLARGPRYWGELTRLVSGGVDDGATLESPRQVTVGFGVTATGVAGGAVDVSLKVCYC